MPRKSYSIEQIIAKLRESASESGTDRGGHLPVIQYQRTNLLSLAERVWWDPHRSSAPIEGTGEGECPTKEAGG
jgi:hypothetical protein